MTLKGSILHCKGYYFVQDENGNTIYSDQFESINLSKEEIEDHIVKNYDHPVKVILYPIVITNYYLNDEIVMRDFKVLNSWAESIGFYKKEVE